MTKCQKEGEKSDEMTLPSHSLLFDFNFLKFFDATMLHINGRILSILLTPPIYIVLATIWCPILVICHIYNF